MPNQVTVSGCLSTLTTNIRDARAFDDAETKVHENYYIAFSLLMLV